MQLFHLAFLGPVVKTYSPHAKKRNSPAVNECESKIWTIRPYEQAIKRSMDRDALSSKVFSSPLFVSTHRRPIAIQCVVERVSLQRKICAQSQLKVKSQLQVELITRRLETEFLEWEFSTFSGHLIQSISSLLYKTRMLSLSEFWPTYLLQAGLLNANCSAVSHNQHPSHTLEQTWL